jgi:hypothetical protein
MFFFEKKNQKTFDCMARRLTSVMRALAKQSRGPLAGSVSHRITSTDKSFLLLFFKKEGLSFPWLT